VWQYGEKNSVEYDTRFVCQSDPCSVKKCGVNSECVKGNCNCKLGFEKNSNGFCQTKLRPPADCACGKIVVEGSGRARDFQDQRFGEYYFVGTKNDKPMYQHKSGNQFLYYQDFEWAIDINVNTRARGVFVPSFKSCPNDEANTWQYWDRPSGQWKFVDQAVTLQCFSDRLQASLDQCGTRHEQEFLRVANANDNGESGPVGAWPWMVSLGRMRDDNSWKHECGASLITNIHVLTAAHCVKNQR